MDKYSVRPDQLGAGFFYLCSEEPRKRKIAKFYHRVDAEEACRKLNSHDKLVEAIRKAMTQLNIEMMETPRDIRDMVRDVTALLSTTLINIDVEKEAP